MTYHWFQIQNNNNNILKFHFEPISTAPIVRYLLSDLTLKKYFSFLVSISSHGQAIIVYNRINRRYSLYIDNLFCPRLYIFNLTIIILQTSRFKVYEACQTSVLVVIDSPTRHKGHKHINIYINFFY